jgi:AcrR family transcriptional regulator
MRFASATMNPVTKCLPTIPIESYMPGKRRQIQKAETRRLLLDTAYDLFQEKGYDKATIRELADRAEVAQGTIFKHFPDKPSLVVAVFENDLQAVVEDAFLHIPSSNIKSQLLYIVQLLYEFYQPRPALFRVLIGQAVRLVGEGEETIQHLLDDFLLRIASLFQTAIKRGELKPGTDVNQAALAYWAYYFMGLNIGLHAKEFDADGTVALVDGLLTMLFQGIGSPDYRAQITAKSG